ncbi:MAG: chromosome segregation protein SMC [Nitrospiraceae bacterium]|nr:chromosome segregation protein SMC [Nitrospiraceae bacterium]
MVKIKKIILHNFKTFARKTEIIFGDKFNVIFGPNGSGKSNTMDALCFVLGRSGSKSMRAEKSANLIFNGGKTKEKPTSATVSIVFTNEDKKFPYDLDEVKISRTVQLNGQSIYKINDKRCTRQEVINLLAIAKIDPDGYNIILQEDIVKFMEMSSLDRRLMLEEVAGINVYEERKKTSLNNLDRVEERIKESEIVLNERKTYLNDLKKDRDQALKYKEIMSQINSYKATNLSHKIEKHNKTLEELNAKIENNNKSSNEIREKINNLKKQIEEKKSQIDKISSEIEKRGEKEQIELNKQLGELKIKEATSNSRLKTCESEIEKINNRIEESKKEKDLIFSQKNEFTKQLNQIKEEKSKLNNELVEVSNQIKGFEEKLNLKNVTELEKKITEIDNKAEEVNEELRELTKKQQDILREKDRIEILLSTIDTKIQKINNLKKEHESEINEITNLKKQFKEITLNLNSYLNEDSSLALKINNEKKSIISLKEEKEKLELKINSVKNTVRSNIAIKKVLELRNTLHGIFGTISELGAVDTKYRKALSILAGSRTNYVVVDNEDTAIKCVKYLKENHLGSVSFIPLNKIRSKTINKDLSLKNKPGFLTYAIDIIRYDPQYERAFEYVFGDAIVIDDIKSSKSIGINKVRMVSLDGDIVETSGVIRGGYNKQVTNAFKDNKLDDDLNKINLEISERANKLTELTDRRNELEDKIKELRVKKANLEGEIIKKEKSLYIDTSDLDASQEEKEKLNEQQKQYDKELNEIENKISELNDKLISLKTEKQKIRAELSQTRDPAKLAELKTYDEKKAEITKRINELESKENVINTRCEILDKDIKSLDNNINGFNKEKNAFESEIKDLTTTIQKTEEEIKDKEDKVKKFYSEFKELFEKKSNLEKEIQKINDTIDEQEQKIRELEQRNNLTQLKAVEIQSQLSNLKAQFEEVKDAEIIKDLDETKIESQLKLFEKQLSAIGGVNLKSLEVYEQVQKEYEQLTEKINKLKQEKGDVLNLIKEIDQRKKELFLKTFDKINENLLRIYPSLSKRGIAELYLENKNDIFSAGVGIMVKESNDKRIDIKSLSGGQKTILALSFLFSIEEYEPAPFYAFDEVEAHLDKQNSEMLAKLIQKYSSKAQYILISHNDEIISSADHLYGVSLDPKTGISKLISLKI